MSGLPYRKKLVKLPTRSVEKIWGQDRLPAPFPDTAGKRIGEIWFEPPAILPQLLGKYIFTSDKLSVQVHPSDTQTEAAGLGRQGKEECWLVIEAEPNAVLGIGLTQNADAQTIRQAALDGSIETMLDWHPVQAGDFFYIPANTIHAIGGGISLIEMQQNSDITYRLYDYGRPRELHLDEGLSVASGEPYPEKYHKRISLDETASLTSGPYFQLDQLAGLPDQDISIRYTAPFLILPTKQAVTVDGETINPGECALASSLDAVRFAPDGICLLAQPL
ncbi:mannose-6-phosphate isomerase [Altericroceibacterium spongiae]|uniref:Mannose-6-phosphate isomerase n=1 Tax=Altericroceibacterium spongiae TaxID=2320269 RepID=A0A420EAB0_9SPHN|nr:class I mannose-6-phosphate isomerase [Altericroceibacterium spongiae]RKF17605.1 mannose-6-phosphate isomerase [Altericroceibacterium spongiae]